MTSKTVNKEIKTLRMLPQGIQVPEITFVKNSKRIVIQGAIHIADRKFYEKVIDRIKGFPGESHLEGIISTDQKHASQKTLLNSAYSAMSAYGNIAYQKDFINQNIVDNKKVFNYDLTDADIGNEIFDKETIEQFSQNIGSIKQKLTKNIFLNIGSSPLLNFMIAASGNTNISIGNKSVILDQRNTLAVEKALSTDKDVFLFWGAKHLEGMKEILLDEGFTIENVKWKTAIRTLRLEKNHHIRKSIITEHLNKVEQVLATIETT